MRRAGTRVPCLHFELVTLASWSLTLKEEDDPSFYFTF